MWEATKSPLLEGSIFVPKQTRDGSLLIVQPLVFSLYNLEKDEERLRWRPFWGEQGEASAEKLPWKHWCNVFQFKGMLFAPQKSLNKSSLTEGVKGGELHNFQGNPTVSSAGWQALNKGFPGVPRVLWSRSVLSIDLLPEDKYCSYSICSYCS